MNNEERPRITITAERHDELVVAEKRLKELHGAGIRALEMVGRTMIELARARQAGRRLADIHKRKRAEIETGWGVGAGALREALDITLKARDEARQERDEALKENEELKVSLREASDLLTEGVEIVEKLEAERDAAVEEVDDAKGREAALTGILNKLKPLKFHLDSNGSSKWEPAEETGCGPPQVVHAICDGAIKPDFFVDRDGTVEDLSDYARKLRKDDDPTASE